ncbi:hypothetical protein PYCC9005_003261 [Savitreella phatthalungensis]
MASPITQVQAGSALAFETGALIHLDVRGTPFELRREELTALPESILLCLFPVGLMADDDEAVRVDFSPDALRYVLDFFKDATENPPAISNVPSLVGGKAAIIVLKEDLDFYIIPPAGTTDTDARALRHAAGRFLVSDSGIFGGLRKSTQGNQVGAAEQHLIDMLCASGFDRHDDWAKRFVEPKRACVTSIALAMLKPTGEQDGEATSQKLLLFWRKPARKCWWDACTPASLHDSHGVERQVKVWARRVWTLELSITGGI